MIPQFQPGRAVEILSPYYGSAYRIGGRLVLTAAHLLVTDTKKQVTECKIRADAPPSARPFAETTATVVWRAPNPAIDIALVELPETIPPVNSVVFGRLPDSQAGEKVAFQMYGWPKFGQTREDGEVFAGGRQVEGLIFLADTSQRGLRVLKPERKPDKLSPDRSEWASVSGAAVVCQGLVIAVQSQHQNPEQADALAAEPLAKIYDDRDWQAILRQHGIDPRPQDVRLIREGGSILHWDRSPYPGLTAFEKADAPIFFGRDDDIREGIKELRNLRSRKERLFVYLGASGSGKSSLVRAGLVPELGKVHHAKNWIVVPPFRPINQGWGDPFENLAGVLSKAFEEHGTPRDSASIQEKLRKPQQRHGLLEVARALTKVAKRDQATVLIVIDQFEELLGQAASEQAQDFLTWFGEAIIAAQQLPAPILIVLATMRSDFLPAFQQCRALQPRVKIFPKLVSPIPVDRFGELIEGPADLVGLKWQPGLVQQIVSDAKTANSLPLLAFTLEKLYERYGQDGLLEFKEYKDLGKLTGAVSQSAQQIFDDYLVAANLEKEAGERLLRQAFAKLVRLDADGKAARRLATWQELPVAAQPLMEKFVAGRLLTKSINKEKVNHHDIQTQHNIQTLVEVSHEALFTAWPLLRDWINNSRGHLLHKQKIEATAKEWQDTKWPKDLLLTGKRLEKAKAFVATYNQDFPLNQVGKKFIAASKRANTVKVFFQQTSLIARDINTPLKQVVSLVAFGKPRT